MSSEYKLQHTRTEELVAELGAWGFITGAEGAEKRKRERENSSEELYVQEWDGSGHFLFH